MNKDLQEILKAMRKRGGSESGINFDISEEGAMRLRGADGKTPEKGVDYWTPEEVNEMVTTIFEAAKLKKGVDYYTEEDKRAFLEEIFTRARPILGKDGKDGIDGRDGKDGKDGKNGKSPDPKDVALVAIKYLETFEGDARISAKALRDLDESVTEILKKGADFTFTENQVKTIKDLLPKYPPMNAGGSGATFLKSLRDVDLSGLTKNADGKFVLGGGGTGDMTKAVYDPANKAEQVLTTGDIGVSVQPAGTYGNVSKVGTPVNNQVGVWTGDGTIEGDTALTFDTATDTLTTGVVVASTAGTPATFTNTTDVQQVTGLIIQGDRATPTSNDQIYLIFKLSDSAGNQDEAARITARLNDVTSTSEDGDIKFGWMIGGTMTDKIRMEGNILGPVTNDGLTLGNASYQFSDLYLAEGGVINWDNGDATLTQAGDVVTLAGADLKVSSPGTASNSVATIDATQTLTNKRVNPRTASSTTSATLTPDLSSANVYFRTTQTEALTIGAPTGTPVIGETILIYVDSAGAQTLTMNATYKVFGAAFPASTSAGKTLMISAQYNGTDWKTLWANAI